MFTGLVQDIGTVEKVEDRRDDKRIVIKTGLDLSREKTGASIACAGCCLTIVEKGQDWFGVDVSQESLSKTTIGSWAPGTRINIEPSLRMGDELGGHFVFGHVDGLAVLDALEREGDSRRLTITPPKALMPCIASKGSVALDGVALTVNEVEEAHFGVNIIPHTWEQTTLKDRKEKDFLHIEIDMLARYVARQMEITK